MINLKDTYLQVPVQGYCTGASLELTLPPFQLKGQQLTVHYPVLWPLHCSLHICLYDGHGGGNQVPARCSPSSIHLDNWLLLVLSQKEATNPGHKSITTSLNWCPHSAILAPWVYLLIISSAHSLNTLCPLASLCLYESILGCCLHVRIQTPRVQ